MSKQLTLPTNTLANARKLWRYRMLAFFVIVAGLCGYLLYTINQAMNVAPASNQAVTAQATPHIDPAVVKQLQSLQDNSVSVQALFNQARENPFQ